MKSDLPNFHPILSMLVNLVRESALYELHRSFEGNFFAGSHEKMEMVRHDDKFMQLITPFFAAGKDALD
jgi:hypothetical protein